MIKILETKIMRGPNSWSASNKFLVVLKLGWEKISEQQMAFLSQHLSNTFSQAELKQANVAAAVLFIAAELQRQSDMAVNPVLHRLAAEPDTAFAVYEYQIERAGVYAGEAAVEIVNSFLNNNAVDIQWKVKTLTETRRRHMLGATSLYLINEIRKRNIPFRRFYRSSLFTLGYGNKQKKMRTAVTDNTSGLGIEIAGDKDETKQVLLQANVPVPKGVIIYDEEELRETLEELKWPVVIKPLDGNHGRGVTTNINSYDKAVFGFQFAKKISDAIIVEEHISGNDFRFLVIDYKLVAVSKRLPAHVTGDGRSTIKELIDEENKNPERGESEDHVLAKIKIDTATHKLLIEKRLTPDSVLKQGEVLMLKETANISAGGTAEDVTEEVHPENKFMAERIARLFSLNICGIDIMARSVSEPLTRENGVVIEVNAGPGLRMHSNPQKGKPRNVAAAIVDMMFPEGDHRIPLVAITGTNGKTTTTRLIAHLAKQAGYTPGYCTTDGIYIDGRRVLKGDCTGSMSAQDVLFDPVIDFAVLECARGGILRSGLGFDQSDVSIVTNITEDHLGLNGINTIEELAAVKLVVPLTTKENGYAILNADDELVYAMREKLRCRIALFSMTYSQRIRQHCEEGGVAAYVREGRFIVYDGKEQLDLGAVSEAPLTLDGRSEAMTRNILAAAIAGVTLGIKKETISGALKIFAPSPENTPGRMNIFDFKNGKLMLDYAHNVDGFRELKVFMDKTEAAAKIGIIAVAGDRRNQDIIAIGSIAAQIFDSIIIRHDRDTRGRENSEISGLIKEGIRQVNPGLPVTIISNEEDAIRHAVENAVPKTFIMVCADSVEGSIDFVRELLKNEGQPVN